MDGLKKPIMESLRIRLSVWLSVAILVIASTGCGFAFYSAFQEAQELQDDVLRQIASLYEIQHLNAPQDGVIAKSFVSDPESRIFIKFLSSVPSSNIDKHSNAPVLRSNQIDGMQTITTGDQTYRVLVRTLSTGQRLAVFQETDIRDEIARDSALRTLLPFLLLIPILIFIVANIIRKIFKPIADLATEIDQRSEQEMHPIASEALPIEIRPFIEAINRMLIRVEQLINVQKRFVADAAHELRSPLTAISLQAQRLAQTEISTEGQIRLNTLRQGIERGRALLDQLLTLARAQTATMPPMVSVSIIQIFSRVVEDLLPLAELKNIDIGVVSDVDVQLLIHEIDLITLVKNLVDNAIRYTPVDGKIDLSVVSRNGITSIVVEDNGPGIPEKERERVFDPFYRILGNEETGSGLGLSIVDTIAVRVSAKIKLSFAHEETQSGLRVEVVFKN
jgi:two-component system OmpR family sensor kinase